MTTEYKCPVCGTLLLTFTPTATGFDLQVPEPGLKVKAINKQERLGAILCTKPGCTGERAVDLVLFGVM